MGWQEKYLPALIMLSLAHITYVPPNKLAANAPNNNERNPSFCSFVSHLTASLICHTSNDDS